MKANINVRLVAHVEMKSYPIGAGLIYFSQNKPNLPGRRIKDR